ncbi:MAG: glycine cleavage T C-terminal barrel domain-containing protein [Actinomycetota bacterium]
MAEITIGSRIAKSPYYDATVAAGATHYTIYNRMYMPTSYGDPHGEYERLMTGVSIWDVGAERQVEIVGPDARAFTDYVSCRNLANLKIGRGRYTPMCNYDGILINDPIAMPLTEDHWWLSIADSDVVLHCQAVAGAKGFDVTVREPDVSPLAIQGPKAQDLCRDLFGDVVDEIGFFHFRAVDLDGIPIVLMRSGWSRQGGFELFLTDGSHGQALWDRAFAAGEPYGAAPGTPHQMERMENGLLSYRSDTDDDTDPIEANLGKWVNLDGDDFVGKAALQARHVDPAARKLLVNVYVDGDMPASEHPWPASIGGTPAGELRAGVWSPKLGRNIGLALVPADLAVTGTTIDVDADGTALTMTITDVPFGDSL